MPIARSVRVLALAAAGWPWLGRIFAAWLAVMLALFLGLLSFVAVQEMTIECRREPSYLLTTEKGDRIKLEDGSGFLLFEEKHLRCRLTWRDAFDISWP